MRARLPTGDDDDAVAGTRDGPPVARAGEEARAEQVGLVLRADARQDLFRVQSRQSYQVITKTSPISHTTIVPPGLPGFTVLLCFPIGL